MNRPQTTQAFEAVGGVDCPSRAVRYPVIYQDTYGVRGSRMIFEAADEVFIATPLRITHRQCLDVAETIYFDWMDDSDLTAEDLADLTANDMGFNFCRVHGRLICED